VDVNIQGVQDLRSGLGSAGRVTAILGVARDIYPDYPWIIWIDSLWIGYISDWIRLD
jgi:hypothetical protein